VETFDKNPTTKNTNNMEDPKNQTDNSISAVDTTPKVTGIGGIFFFSDNPQETKEWYAKNLGLEINEWGSSFESRNVNRPDEINSLQWSPFKKGDEYFSPSKKDFMINYRVQNIEGLVNKLEENGVTILGSIVTYNYGKFVHIMDAEGNKIELWEPVD
jgi:predicted enzyme related to lactoylglutathione lyase